MKTLDINQATGALRRYVRELANEPLLVTDGGQPVAALVPLDEDDARSVSRSPGIHVF